MRLRHKASDLLKVERDTWNFMTNEGPREISFLPFAFLAFPKIKETKGENYFLFCAISENRMKINTTWSTVTDTSISIIAFLPVQS